VLDLPARSTWIPISELWKRWDGIAVHIAGTTSELPKRVGDQHHLAISLLAIILLVLSGLVHHHGLRRFRRDYLCRAWQANARIILPFFVGTVIVFTVIAWHSLVRFNLSAGSGSLEILPAYHNVSMGLIQELGAVEAKFRIVNRTAAVVRIQQVRSSCGCARAFVDDDEIPTGEYRTLSVVFDSKTASPRPYRISVLLERPHTSQIEVHGMITD
jgi:hypothetical protein